MIEKDFKTRDRILEDILHSYASNPELTKSIVLQGGGAMHFIYSSPRYSNDLDFVMPDLQEEENHIIGLLTQPIEVGGQKLSPRIRTVGENVKVIRASYKTECGIVGKVEIVGVPSFMREKTAGKYTPISVENPQEIYADKIVANLSRLKNRGTIKGSDLFDLDYISRNLSDPPSQELLKQKADSYREKRLVNSEGFEKVARHIVDPKNIEIFVDQIRKTLMPDVFRLHKFDKAFFALAADHFLRYQ